MVLDTRQLLLIATIFVLSTWLCVEGTYEFLSMNFVTDFSKPGYNLYNFMGVVKFTFLLPVSMFMVGVFTSQLFRKRASSPKMVTCVVFVLTVLSIVAMVLSYNHFGTHYLIDCMYVGCIGTSTTSHGLDQPLTSGAIFFFVSMIFSVLHSILLLNCLYSLSSSAAMPTESSSSPLLALRAGRSRPVERKSTTSSTIIQCLVFLVFLPLCLFLSSVLPNSHVGMSPQGISANAAKHIVSAEHKSAYMTTVNWVWNEGTLVLSIYPDLWIFYGFLYAASLLAFAAKASARVRQLLHSRVSLSGLVTTVGEVLVFVMFAITSVLWLLYWGHDHKYHYGEHLTRTAVAARTMGQLSNFLISLLLLPVSRNSVWTSMLGVSWERMLTAHIALGYAFMASVFVHMALWWRQYDSEGVFPHDILAVPTYFPLNGRPLSQGPMADNFTIPLVTIASWAMFVLMGVLSLPVVRRAAFEVFYYAHHFAFVLVGAAMWHAASLWFFMLPAITFYLADRVIRFQNATQLVEVRSLARRGDVVALSLSARSSGCPLRAWFGGGEGVRKCDATSINHEMGQYVFVNVPAISPFQWHPFTLSSSPWDPYSSLHIRNMGAGSFTGDLWQLAGASSSAEQEGPSLGDRPGVMRVNSTDMRASHAATGAGAAGGAALEVLVDGPYGTPVDPQLYDRVVLVCGGIGVTPMHSTFRGLYQLAGAGLLPPTLARVDLVWSARDPDLFRMFAHTLQEVDGCPRVNNTEFTTSLFVSGQSGRPSLHGEGGARRSIGEVVSMGLNGRSVSSALEDANEVVAPMETHKKDDLESPLPHFVLGRPDVRAMFEDQAVARAVEEGQRVLLFVCGPAGMVENCSKVAFDARCEFRSEVFEF